MHCRTPSVYIWTQYRPEIDYNNAEVHHAFGIAARRGTDAAKAEMDINYFGLLRLAQEFGPALKGRSADGTTHAAAWVNLLSVYALSNYPPHGTFSASKAAAYSLAQCLRAEMRTSGIRVINVINVINVKEFTESAEFAAWAGCCRQLPGFARGLRPSGR